MGKIFTYDQLRVFFKHTDYYGYVHLYNYLEWMSYVREAYFQELVTNFMDLCKRDIKMVTALTEYHHSSDAVFGDQIVVKIFSRNIKRLSFDVVFQFFSKANMQQLGEGIQRLTFLNATTWRPERIPEELKEQVLQYTEILPEDA